MARLSRIIDKDRLFDRLAEIVEAWGGEEQMAEEITDEVYHFLSELDVEDVMEYGETDNGGTGDSESGA